MRRLLPLILFFAAPAAWAGDCRIDAAAVRHDTFDGAYRRPGGAVPAGTTVRLALRTAPDDVTAVRLRVWDAHVAAERWYPLVREAAERWVIDLPAPEPTLLYYLFELEDAGDGCALRRWYLDDDPRFRGGGTGVLSADLDTLRSFQITVHGPLEVPEWIRRGVVYQVFPDRFRDGDPTTDRPGGDWYYGREGATLRRSGSEAWNTTVCDPWSLRGPACPGVASHNFYGGDLDGVTEKVEAGYFDGLGVSVLYLTPVFRSPSNHRYDTADFFTVDPHLGGDAAFARLVEAARRHGLRLVLDGVFNHVSADSPYFDRYGRFEAVGACESEASPFRDWFYFPHFDRAAGEGSVRCAGDATYEAWWGYASLPKLRAESPAVRALVYSAGEASVAPRWTARGAAGWRLDVGGDVDRGHAHERGNDFWEGFRAAIRAVDPEAVVIGEEWDDASSWLLGREWDSAMNYRLRSALLGWLFTACEGDGCQGGQAFSDGDSNAGSASGAIRRLGPTDFDGRLRSIAEDYPLPALQAMMNLAGSHDTNRILFLLARGNRNDLAVARHRLRELWLFLMTYVGAPTLYYGDEVAVDAPGGFDGQSWHDDPYNRVPFPWDDTPGDYAADLEAQAELRRLTSLRWSHRALQDGGITHGVLVDDGLGLYAFARPHADGAALVVLNRGDAARQVEVPARGFADGTRLVDALSGAEVTVAGGRARVTVPGAWGAILLEPEAVDTPSAPAVTVEGATLRWSVIRTDTMGGREVAVAYEVWKDAERVGEVAPPPFGGTLAYDGLPPGRYRVTARNAFGHRSAPAEVVVGGRPAPDDAGLDAEPDASPDAVADAAAPPEAADAGDGLPPPQDAGRLDRVADATPAARAGSGGCRGAPGAPAAPPAALLAFAVAAALRRR